MDLGRALATYEAEEKQAVFAEIDQNTAIARVGWRRPPSGPPETARILTGEIIYHLRSALDHLVFVLVAEDAGFRYRHTQFPITNDQRAFKEQSKTRLKGMSADHVAVIESLQPFTGCQWTALLRDLSNPDKHQHLTPVVAAGEHSFRIKRTEGGFDMKFQPKVLTTFLDETPVLRTLADLCVRVTEVLNMFQANG